MQYSYLSDDPDYTGYERCTWCDHPAAVSEFSKGPWAEVLEELGDTIRARITNKLFHEYSEQEQAQFLQRECGDETPLEQLHSFKKGDEVCFKRGEFEEWVPV